MEGEDAGAMSDGESACVALLRWRATERRRLPTLTWRAGVTDSSTRSDLSDAGVASAWLPLGVERSSFSQWRVRVRLGGAGVKPVVISAAGPPGVDG